ncbi:MAG: PKD domain-containing protein [Gammaproteobacteria bacterium]|nr:PKD domain-containing protein [Gammaproteobacteria bacterium]
MRNIQVLYSILQYGLFLITVTYVDLVRAESNCSALNIDYGSAGEFISQIEQGGRVVTVHNCQLYLGAEDTTSVWDFSDFRTLQRLQNQTTGVNGHAWVKFLSDGQQAFWRSYAHPDSNNRFVSLNNMLDRQPWNDPFNYYSNPNQWFSPALNYPYHIHQTGIYDSRSGQLINNQNLIAQSGTNTNNIWSIGNLVIHSPTENNPGLAIFDVGDPQSPRLLDTLTGNYTQYTNAWHIWRHYVVIMSGANSNGQDGDANMVVIDIGDPEDIHVEYELPIETAGGRYIQFQDEFGFSNNASGLFKINMLTGELALKIDRPASVSGPDSMDFQPIPYGHVVMASGAQATRSHSIFYQHQDTIDTRSPTVGWHWPQNGATDMPLTSRIGLVINETLNDLTINETSLQLTSSSGQVVETVITSSQHDVINIIPKQNLIEDTTYTLIVAGIEDVAGNTIEPYEFQFSTGSEIDGGNNSAPIISAVTITQSLPLLVNSVIEIAASASDPDDDPLEYRWDFGDGNTTTWVSSPTVQHQYLSAGNFILTLQVRDSAQLVTSLTLNVQIVEPEPELYPQQSSRLLIDQQRRRLWSVNPDNATVSHIHVDELSGLVEINVCDKPTSIALDVRDQIWVTCFGDDSIKVIDPDNNQIIESVQLGYGAAPVAVLFEQQSDTGYVVLSGKKSVLRLNANTRDVVPGSINLTGEPHAFALSGNDDFLYITQKISRGNAGIVWKINANDFSLSTVIQLPIDTQTEDSPVEGRGLPNYLLGIALNPNSDRAMVLSNKDNILRGLQRDEQLRNFETIKRALISPINLSSNQVENSSFDIDDSVLPSSTVYSQSGNQLFVTLMGNNRLIVLNPFTGNEITRVEVGRAPDAIAIDHETSRVFVKNFLSRNISVFDGSGVLTNTSFELPELQSPISMVTNELLQQQILTGKQIFYNAQDPRMGQDGYISCAACHLDGESDGQTWDHTQMGEGLRNTTSLTGQAGMQHGRVHWTANFDEIQDFEGDIRELFSGTGFLSDQVFNAGTRSDPLGDPKAGLSDELDALASYVSSLGATTIPRSPFRENNGSLTASAVQGKQIFIESGCHGCHGGESFTNSETNQLFDVGTLKDSSGNRLGDELTGLDTPTLRGVWKTAPYLHDGSASTLLEVINLNSNDDHGVTAHLSVQDKERLVDYLLQIDGFEQGIPFPDQIAPTADFAFSNDTPVNVAISFDGSLSTDDSGEIVQYNWQFGDNNTAEGLSVIHTYNQAGVYAVELTVSDSAGNSHSITKNITVTEISPTAEFSYSSDSFDAPATVSFFASPSLDSDGEIISYSWDFGNGLVSDLSIAATVFQEPGEYLVTLTVMDNSGLTSTTQKNIRITEETEITIGNLSNLLILMLMILVVRRSYYFRIRYSANNKESQNV